MELIEALFSRRAIRAYQPRPVEEATLKQLLRAAIQAPSAMNAQPWLFAVVQNVKQLKRYSDGAKAMLLERSSHEPKARHYAELLRQEQFNVFYDATTLVAIASKEPGPYAEADCWLAAQNLMLAAHAAGLGTCPIGLAVQMLSRPEVKAELGLPKSAEVVAPIIVGYPLVTPDPVPRGEPNIVSWSR